jgi:GntR family transcriptional regulator, transcriptional repressor for pyruvate dehydrogenase complex
MVKVPGQGTSPFQGGVGVRRESPLSYLEPLETRARGVAVLDALADMIERAGLGIGDRLPPEISLAETLGVGRSTIREALNRWEGLGIIKRRQGDGTYLTARVQTSHGLVPTMVRLEGEALLRLIEVRRALENDVVRKATLNATPAQRRQISELCTLLLAEVLRVTVGHDVHGLDGTIYGLLLVLFIIYMPRGILGVVLMKWEQWRSSSDKPIAGAKGLRGAP